MKYVKLFESFKEEDIQAICKEYGIENYTINTDGSIDVDEDVSFFSGYISSIPIKFGRIDGAFYCAYHNLTTLEGSPTYVGKCFNCRNNLLSTLNGAPNYW